MLNPSDDVMNDLFGEINTFTSEKLQSITEKQDKPQKIMDDVNNPNTPCNLESKLQFGLCRFYGVGIPKNISQGLEVILDIWFCGKEYSNIAFSKFRMLYPTLSAIESCFVFSCYNNLSKHSPYIQTILGIFYHYGIGVFRDERITVEYYTKAANQGYAPAQNLLGYCYRFGLGVPKDEKTTFEYYTRAANQGYAPAQSNLGFCYRFGIGIPKDEKTAVEYYTKSASQGNASAQSQLGHFYRFGIGVSKDEKTAAKWFAKAAQQGFVKSSHQGCVSVTAPLDLSPTPTPEFFLNNNFIPSNNNNVTAISTPYLVSTTSPQGIQNIFMQLQQQLQQVSPLVCESLRQREQQLMQAQHQLINLSKVEDAESEVQNIEMAVPNTFLASAASSQELQNSFMQLQQQLQQISRLAYQSLHKKEQELMQVQHQLINLSKVKDAESEVQNIGMAQLKQDDFNRSIPVMTPMYQSTTTITTTTASSTKNRLALANKSNVMGLLSNATTLTPTIRGALGISIEIPLVFQATMEISKPSHLSTLTRTPKDRGIPINLSSTTTPNFTIPATDGLGEPHAFKKTKIIASSPFKF